MHTLTRHNNVMRECYFAYIIIINNRVYFLQMYFYLIYSYFVTCIYQRYIYIFYKMTRISNIKIDNKDIFFGRVYGNITK